MTAFSLPLPLHDRDQDRGWGIDNLTDRASCSSDSSTCPSGRAHAADYVAAAAETGRGVLFDLTKAGIERADRGQDARQARRARAAPHGTSPMPLNVKGQASLADACQFRLTGR